MNNMGKCLVTFCKNCSGKDSGVSFYRSCTILCGSATILLVLAVLFAFLGHCNKDNKTVVACGFFILAGLFLGTCLVVFVSSLSETFTEVSHYQREPASGPVYDYRYGWCFFTAGFAFVMTKLAALFSIVGYLNRFSTVDEMVRRMVPGAERKLLERQHFSAKNNLMVYSKPSTHQYNPLTVDRPKCEGKCSPLLMKTPPDVCSTSKYPDIGIEEDPSSGTEANYSTAQTMAGQTIPITVKNFNSTAPLSLSNLPLSKYGTIHHAGIVHQDFYNSSEVGRSSASDYRCKSKTLQHQRSKKKFVKIETFQVPESSFPEFANKRTIEFGFPGSAV